MLKILAIGDVVGDCGVNFLVKKLPTFIKENEIDFTIVNGENALPGSGISLNITEDLLTAGADCITLGNHAFNKKDVEKAFDRYPNRIIRPLNYDGSLEGEGYTILDAKGYRISVVNLVGRIYLSPVNCPFLAMDKVLDYLKDKTDIIIADFHAEATSEKKAFGYYVDGRVSAVFGTHTHTPTADEQILPNGTGFITDIGMTGATDSVLGLKKEISIGRIVYHRRSRFDWADTNPAMMGAIFYVDETTGKCHSVERIKVVE
ncbi:MAG: TIGR00282 family metallophosphoesterase [Clostridia bacterium]|nr:TIGR00282 family metallophosphoesterase [Clostridia bacterium]